MTPSDFARLQDAESLLRDAGHTSITIPFETFRKLMILAWKGKASK